MFDHDPLASLNMSVEEICAAASINLAQIHTAAADYLAGGDVSVEASLAVYNLTAALCFPATYKKCRAEAISMVTEIIDLIKPPPSSTPGAGFRFNGQ